MSNNKKLCPKICILTAYSGENEFETCCNMIKKQYMVSVHHIIVENKPILEAFDYLYSSWEKIKYDYDLMVQVDADMILNNEHCIREMYDILYSNDRYNVLTAPVKDFYTNTNIWGIHAYKPIIKFNRLKNKYAPDEEYDKTNRVRVPGWSLDSKAFCSHGSMPNLRTAFHFGWHRRLRANAGKRHQFANLKKIKFAYEKTKDPMRGHALNGAKAAENYYNASGDTSPIEYNNPIFIEHLVRYESELQR